MIGTERLFSYQPLNNGEEGSEDIVFKRGVVEGKVSVDFPDLGEDKWIESYEAVLNLVKSSAKPEEFTDDFLPEVMLQALFLHQ